MRKAREGEGMNKMQAAKIPSQDKIIKWLNKQGTYWINNQDCIGVGVEGGLGHSPSVNIVLADVAPGGPYLRSYLYGEEIDLLIAVLTAARSTVAKQGKSRSQRRPPKLRASHERAR